MAASRQACTVRPACDCRCQPMNAVPSYSRPNAKRAIRCQQDGHGKVKLKIRLSASWRAADATLQWDFSCWPKQLSFTTGRATDSGEMLHQLLGFLLLLAVTFLQYFLKDVLGAIGITHINIGAGQVQLGADFIEPGGFLAGPGGDPGLCTGYFGIRRQRH